MQSVREQLQARGIPTESFDDEQVAKVARAIGGITFPPKERKVQVVEYTNKAGHKGQYVKTDPIPLGVKANGKTESAQGLFLRVEALDQCIEDLLAAKALLK
jgi:uncharacterized circularly permuted ATP-grasp superfamily protein